MQLMTLTKPVPTYLDPQTQIANNAPCICTVNHYHVWTNEVFRARKLIRKGSMADYSGGSCRKVELPPSMATSSSKKVASAKSRAFTRASGKKPTKKHTTPAIASSSQLGVSTSQRTTVQEEDDDEPTYVGSVLDVDEDHVMEPTDNEAEDEEAELSTTMQHIMQLRTHFGMYRTVVQGLDCPDLCFLRA